MKEDNTAEEQEEAAMQIHILAKDKSFAVQLASSDERNSWFNDLTAACRYACTTPTCTVQGKRVLVYKTCPPV